MGHKSLRATQAHLGRVRNGQREEGKNLEDEYEDPDDNESTPSLGSEFETLCIFKETLQLVF